MCETNKKVFISYSWAVQDRVIELAERLINNGIDVIVDVYDLKEGHDKYFFMEQSVNDPTVDRVLIICDKTYTDKANNRSGGVGDETIIISPELYGKSKQDKFIPIIFEVDDEGKIYCPTYINTRIYINLSFEGNYEQEYEKLLRNIYEKPIYKKPALGKKPEWLENQSIDLSSIRDVIKQVRGYKGDNQSKVAFLLKKAENEFVKATKQYTLSKDKDVQVEIIQVIDQFKECRDLFIDYCEVLIASGLTVSEPITSLIEQLYNDLHDSTEESGHNNFDVELYDFVIWELFISATATMLHYEQYKELHNILTHTYFLKKSSYSSSIEGYNYTKFRAYSRIIEEGAKKICNNPKLFTLAGDILVKREKKPILTKESISNADLLLYQLVSVLTIKGEGHEYWFPTTYVYHTNLQPIWQKLKSKKFCEAILPLLGVSNIDELKILVSKNITEEGMKYRGCFDSPLTILSSIKADEIGSLN